MPRWKDLLRRLGDDTANAVHLVCRFMAGISDEDLTQSTINDICKLKMYASCPNPRYGGYWAPYQDRRTCQGICGGKVEAQTDHPTYFQIVTPQKSPNAQG